jgi:hypothetical protein
VEKDRFNYLVNNYNSLSQQETAELRLEQDRYGYCQVLHQLIARGDQDNQTEMKEQSLHVAAVYSTDRSVLKKVMTEPRVDRSAIPPPMPKEQVNTPQEISKEPEVETKIISKEEKGIKETPAKEIEKIKEEAIQKSEPDFDVDAALSRFIEDLKPMHEKKLQFEKAMEEFENKIHQPLSKNKIKASAEVQKDELKEEPKEAKPKRRGRPRKTKPPEENVNTSEKLLDEIKTTKKKVRPESQKQKEQIEIIDQFIKAKPSISKPSGDQQQLDLSETPESYNENVVSETLALILIKQGKKEKAVEVLRKLIWKFPQKKAYFAAHIEDLTK